MTLRTRAGATLAAIFAATLAATLTAAPASAETASYDDPADATASLADIRAVGIDHSTARLRILVDFTDLRRRSVDSSPGLTVLLDTDPERRGAELRLTTGLQSGTDYQLMRVRKGEAVGEPLTCPHRLRLGFARDRLVFRADSECLGAAESVRIGMKMRDDQDASHPVVDWLGEPRSFTDWIASS